MPRNPKRYLKRVKAVPPAAPMWHWLIDREPDAGTRVVVSFIHAETGQRRYWVCRWGGAGVPATAQQWMEVPDAPTERPKPKPAPLPPPPPIDAATSACE